MLGQADDGVDRLEAVEQAEAHADDGLERAGHEPLGGELLDQAIRRGHVDRAVIGHRQGLPRWADAGLDDEEQRLAHKGTDAGLPQRVDGQAATLGQLEGVAAEQDLIALKVGGAPHRMALVAHDGKEGKLARRDRERTQVAVGLLDGLVVEGGAPLVVGEEHLEELGPRAVGAEAEDRGGDVEPHLVGIKIGGQPALVEVDEARVGMGVEQLAQAGLLAAEPLGDAPLRGRLGEGTQHVVAGDVEEVEQEAAGLAHAQVADDPMVVAVADVARADELPVVARGELVVERVEVAAELLGQGAGLEAGVGLPVAQLDRQLPQELTVEERRAPVLPAATVEALAGEVQHRVVDARAERRERHVDVLDEVGHPMPLGREGLELRQRVPQAMAILVDAEHHSPTHSSRCSPTLYSSRCCATRGVARRRDGGPAAPAAERKPGLRRGAPPDHQTQASGPARRAVSSLRSTLPPSRRFGGQAHAPTLHRRRDSAYSRS